MTDCIPRVAKRSKYEPFMASSLRLASGYTLQYVHRLEDLRPQWDSLAPVNNRLLQAAFLSALEAHPPKDMQFAYGIILREDIPIGILYFQRIPFALSEALPAASFWKQLVSLLIHEEMLVCGNLLFTGSHGMSFTEDAHIDKAAQLSIAQEALLALAGEWKNEGSRLTLLVLKDATQSDIVDSKPQWLPYEVEPGMGMALRPQWESWGDYMLDLRSKYRVRTKRAKKQLQGLTRIRLSSTALARFSAHLYGLYLEVIEGADFNLVHVAPDFFTAMAEALGSDYVVYAYFEHDRPMPVGFYTLLHNADHTEAHYIGYSTETNARYQLYQNMLYDMIDDAIHQGSKYLHFARTASGIKSTVGAEPEQYFSYAHHRCPLRHRLLPWLFRRFFSAPEWIQRHPFKTTP